MKTPSSANHSRLFYAIENLERRALLAAVTWDGGGDGTSWADPLNWSTNAVPTTLDDVTIDVPGNASVTVNDNQTFYALSLICSEAIVVQSDLRVDTHATLNAGGSINSGGRLFADSITLNSAVSMSYGTVYFTGTESLLDGPGPITLNETGPGPGILRSSGAHTIASSITVQGVNAFHINPAGDSVITNYGSITCGGSPTIGGPNNTVINHGQLTFESNASIDTYNLINAEDGTITLNNAHFRFFHQSWTNLGTIYLNGGSVAFDGWYQSSDIGTLVRNGGTVYLRGELDNQGQIFSLDSIGDVTLWQSGTVFNTIFEASGNQKLTIWGGWLANTTLNVNTVVENSAILGIGTSVMINTDLQLGNGADITFHESDWGGTGSIVSNNTFPASIQCQSIPEDFEVTLAPGDQFYPFHYFVNDGILNFVGDGPNSTINIDDEFTPVMINNGTINATNIRLTFYTLQNGATGVANFTESTITLDESTAVGAPSWFNDGQLHFINSTVNLDGRFSWNDLDSYTRVGGTMWIKGILEAQNQTRLLNDGPWYVDGSIVGGVLNIVHPGSLTVSGGTLDAVAFNGLVLVDEASFIRNGLTLDGMLQLEANLTFTGAAALVDGDGVIEAAVSAGRIIDNCNAGADSISLTFGQNIDLNLTPASHLFSNGTPSVLLVQGDLLIDSNDVFASPMDLGATNQIVRVTGSLEIVNDATVMARGLQIAAGGVASVENSKLTLLDGSTDPLFTWINLGSLELVNVNLELGSNFYYSDLGIYTRSGGTTTVIGRLENANQTLLLDDHTGNWLLAGGTIAGGAVDSIGEQRLFVNPGTLNGVTLNTPLIVQPNSILYIEGNFTLNDEITLGDIDDEPGAIYFRTTPGTFSGNGSINQIGSGSTAIWNNLPGANQVVTIPSTITINLGPTATIGSITSSGRIINNGEIYFDGQNLPASNIQLGNPGTGVKFINNGKIEFSNSARVNALGMSGNLNHFRFKENSIVTINGTYTLNELMIVPLGSTLFLKGTWTRAASMDIGGSVIFDHLGTDNGATYNAIAAAILSGYNGGSWDGEGLRDTLALLHPNTTLIQARSSELLGPSGGTFNGLAVDSTSVIVRHSLAGDLNLDGTVNFTDLLTVAQNYGQTGVPFTSGDVNGDGVVDFYDLLIIAQLYGQSTFSSESIKIGSSYRSVLK